MEEDKTRTNIMFEWADSDSYVVNEKGELTKAGTCILLNGSIFFLSPLTNEQLNDFKEKVTLAIDHELNKREI